MRLGFGRPGFRRHLAQGPPLVPRDLRGRVLITGGTRGIGRAAAEGLAGLGASITIWGRDVAEGQRVADALDGAFDRVDLGDLEAVRQAADAVHGPLDAVVLNAGAMPLARRLTPQGHELVWGAQVLGHVQLLRRLRSAGRLGGSTRVVWVTSGGMYLRRLELDDLRRDRGYQRHAVYANAKRAQAVLNAALAERWPELWTGAMHPGWADTAGVQHSMPWFRRLTRPILRDAGEGADTIVWLVAQQGPLPTGRLWFDRSEAPVAPVPGTATPPDRVQALLSTVFEATTD